MGDKKREREKRERRQFEVTLSDAMRAETFERLKQLHAERETK